MKKSFIALVIAVLLYPISGLAGDWALFCYRTRIYPTDDPVLRLTYDTIGDWLKTSPSPLGRGPHDRKFFSLISPHQGTIPLFRTLIDSGGRRFSSFHGEKRADTPPYLEISGYSNTTDEDIGDLNNVFVLDSKKEAQDFCERLETLCKEQNKDYEHVAGSVYGDGPYPIVVRYWINGHSNNSRAPSEAHSCSFNFRPGGTR